MALRYGSFRVPKNRGRWIAVLLRRLVAASFVVMLAAHVWEPAVGASAFLRALPTLEWSFFDRYEVVL